MSRHRDTHIVFDPRDPDRETVLRAVFEVASWGSPPQAYGPPELCHQGEPAEISLIGAHNPSGADILGQLTSEQQEAVEAEILEEYDFRKPDRDDY